MSSNTADFPGFHKLFEEPQTPLAKTEKNTPATLARLKEAAGIVEETQPGYHPIFGQPSSETGSKRTELLRRDCALIEREFADVRRKNQIRILDIGCNSGYVSFTLAQTFPNTIGFDLSAKHIALCQAIGAHTGSSAKFHSWDMLALVESGKADLENLDCVLLLNVVHQLIFAKGIPYVKRFIAALAASVDFLVVELAPRADYVRHGKDLELPLEPSEIFEQCTESTITLEYDDRRPVYTLRRRRLKVNDRSVDYTSRNYSDHISGNVNRKYYFGADSFTKVIRYTALQGAGKFQAELRNLQTLRGLGIAPEPISWDNDGQIGRICMERLYGRSLDIAITERTLKDKASCLREIIRVCAGLAGKSLYQNDFSSHNFIMLSDGSFRMIDFEQCGSTLVRDPFAAFLWITHDIMAGTLDYHRKAIAKKIILKDMAGERANSAVYPPMEPDDLRMIFGAALSEIISEAKDTPLSWHEFIHKAHERLVKAAPAEKSGRMND